MSGVTLNAQSRANYCRLKDATGQHYNKLGRSQQDASGRMISERNLFWACAAMLVVFFMTYSSRQQAQLDTIKAQLVSKNQLISPHPEARDLVIPTSGLPALTCPSCGAASPPASQRAWMNEAARSLYISNHRNQVLGAMQDVAVIF